jgi:hypothetical protein
VEEELAGVALTKAASGLVVIVDPPPERSFDGTFPPVIQQHGNTRAGHTRNRS